MAVFRRSAQRGRSVTTIGIGALATALALTGCSASADGGSGVALGGSSVEWGADLSAYASALADMEPVTLIWDSGAVAEGTATYEATQNFLATIDEGSGGKISIELHTAGEIVAITETDAAIQDGRLDFGTVFPQYDPAEYPVANLFIQATLPRDPRLVTGTLSNMAALMDVAWNTPELLAEYADKGLSPLNIIDGQGATAMACTEPVHTLADLEGKQVRVGSTIAQREVEALGMIPVSMPYAEVYEALQRGVIDCGITALVIINTLLDVAPYLVQPSTVSFASVPTTNMAGARFRSLPPEAQQLLMRAYIVMVAESRGGEFDYLIDNGLKTAMENGGGISTFDTEVDAKLIALHEEILGELTEAAGVDGEALVARITAAHETWVTRVEELGYVDAGPIDQFTEWADPTVYNNVDAWADAVFTEIYAHAEAMNG